MWLITPVSYRYCSIDTILQYRIDTVVLIRYFSIDWYDTAVSHQYFSIVSMWYRCWPTLNTDTPFQGVKIISLFSWQDHLVRCFSASITHSAFKLKAVTLNVDVITGVTQKGTLCVGQMVKRTLTCVYWNWRPASWVKRSTGNTTTFVVSSSYII